MKLSIIIPFYQVEQYIEPCLEALERITDGEILFVDDCGQDHTRQKVEQFCRTHDSARLITRAQNGGLSAARNTGFSEARGEYVYFLDSDDIPVPEGIEALCRRAEEERLDVIKGQFLYLMDETGETRPGVQLTPTEVLSGADLFADECRNGEYEPMVWQCLYRREYLEKTGLRMTEGTLFEDELFQAPALLHAERVRATDVVLVWYRQRADSIMQSFARSSRWCKSYLRVCRDLSALAETIPHREAGKQLKKRIGQIALNVGKNIEAYQLSGRVREEALQFLRENRKELAEYAGKSGDAMVAAQGMLLACSERAFFAAYRRMRGDGR